jgi:tetratricopeptide (TPR) repeat protein
MVLARHHCTYTEQIPLHSESPSQCSPLLLLERGSKLLDLGQYDEAMSMLDASFLAASSPSQIARVDLSTITEWEMQQGLNKPLNILRQPVDTYLEDVEDVGPRPFRTAFMARDCVDIDFLQLVICYNKALIYHAKKEISLASSFYELTIMKINQALLPNAFLPNEWLHLAMCAYNNLGHINYCQQIECLALLQFESSLGFGKTIQNPSSSYSLDYATVLSNWCRSKYMDADVCIGVFAALEEVLRLRESLLNWDHPDVASAHFNLGMAEYLRKNNRKAMSHLLQYLKVASHHVNNGIESGLDPLPGLIYVLLIKNDVKEDKMSRDLVWGLRSLQEKRNEVGPQHSEVASVLNFIGTLLFQKQELEHALLFFQEELRLEEQFTHADDKFGVCVTCNNIGRILQELGRYPEAIRYYQKALQDNFRDSVVSELDGFGKPSKGCNDDVSAPMLDESFSGPPAAMNLFSTVCYNLGLIHDKMGAYIKAIKAFQMSLNIRRAMLGPDHADIACLVYNIGVLQMEQQFLSEATQSFREALRIRSVGSTGQLNDRHVVKTLQKLASLHKSKGNIQGALEACREVMQILKGSDEFELSCRGKNMGATLCDIAELYHALGNLDMALQNAFDGVQSLRSCGMGECTSSSDLASYIEQEATSLLLVGSLYHELCEPTQAQECFGEAVRLIQSSASTVSVSLLPLLEVSRLLRFNQCAAEA